MKEQVLGWIVTGLFVLSIIGILIFVNRQHESKREYIEGTIIKEYGNIGSIVESSGALFGNESIKFSKPYYCITVDTQQGEYIIELNDYAGSKGGKTVENMSIAIKEGTRIRVTTFSKDRILVVDPDDIEILNKKSENSYKWL